MVYLAKDMLISSYILQKHVWVIDQSFDFRATQYVKSQMSIYDVKCVIYAKMSAHFWSQSAIYGLIDYSFWLGRHT